jgi:uncharacterized sulfatase
MPSATRRKELADRPVFGAIYPNDAVVLGRPSRHVRGRWVRAGRFKLVVPGAANNRLPMELYDLSHDPREALNLVEAPQHVARVAEMKRLLDAWWTGADDRQVTQR